MQTKSKASPEKLAQLKKQRIEKLQPYMWKPGQSGNPAGRPKGKNMKDWAREVLSKMSEEERQEFLKGIPKDIIWKMAEGNPAQDLTSGGEKLNVIPIYSGQSIKKEDDGTNIQPTSE